MVDYYKILGVKSNAPISEIKKAYRKLAVKHHPDKPNGNSKKFKQVSEAYDILRNPEKRNQYDMGFSIDLSEYEMSNNIFDNMFQEMRKEMKKSMGNFGQNIMRSHMMNNMFDDFETSMHKQNKSSSYSYTRNGNKVIKKSVVQTGRNGETVTKQKIYTNLNGKENRRSRIIKKNKDGIHVVEDINGKKKSYRKSNKSYLE